jgi:hypothetical protein
MNMNQGNQVGWLSLTIALLTIILSTVVLALSVWEHGMILAEGDSLNYVRTGAHLYLGRGVSTILAYDPSSDTMFLRPSSHYPPLFSMVYAAGLALNISPLLVPSAIALAGWVFFLAGMGVLAYRLSTSMRVGMVVVVVAAIAYPFWYMFQYAMSEIIFLPLLVWLMVVLVDLPTRSTQKLAWLVVACMLMALLILTRYVGVFVLAATGIWWGAWHISRRDWRTLITGWLMLGGAVLPFAAWVAYNSLRSQAPLSSHLKQSYHTFGDGLVALFAQSGQLVFPAAHIVEFIVSLDVPGFLVYLVLYILLVLVLVRLGVRWYLRHRPSLLTLVLFHRTPICIFLFFYVMLYTVAQPFLRFWPIDTRDMTTILCLALPWLFAMLARAPRRWSSLVMSGYVAVNVLFAFGPTLITGLPSWVQLNPPSIHEVISPEHAPESPDRDSQGYRSGLFEWLKVQPPRMKDLSTHHADILAWLQTFDSDLVVLSNGRDLFTPHLFDSAIEPVSDPYVSQIPQWLQTGDCTSRYHTMVIIFHWDYMAERAVELQQQVEQKCPGLPQRAFQHSVVYQLRQADE